MMLTFIRYGPTGTGTGTGTGTPPTLTTYTTLTTVSGSTMKISENDHGKDRLYCSQTEARDANRNFDSAQ